MIRKPAHKDTEFPAGQVVPIGKDTLLHNIEQWKKLQEQRNKEKYPIKKEENRKIDP